MSRGHTMPTMTVVSFPRASGDEPQVIEVAVNPRGFSPRERG